MKFDELIVRTQDETSALELVKEFSLIHVNKSCILCGHTMRLENIFLGRANKARWRCCKSSCRSSSGLFNDSIFYNIHFPLSKALRCIYYHAFNISHNEIAEQLMLNEKTVYNFIKKFNKKMDNDSFNQNLPLLGGILDDIFEVDETHLISRRDARGRILKSERYWVIGLISRRTKEFRCILSRNRTSEICNSFIRMNIAPGSTIITDKWKGYNSLTSMGYNHYTVNHKIEFVDKNNPIIHTQNIEIRWRYLKKHIPCVNTFELLQKYMNRYLIRYNLRLKSAEERFHFILIKNQV